MNSATAYGGCLVEIQGTEYAGIGRLLVMWWSSGLGFGHWIGLVSCMCHLVT